jgi:hypothetical protein
MHDDCEFRSFADHMLNWLHTYSVSHDSTTPWSNTLYSFCHDMRHGSNGGSEHWPSHWSLHEHSGTFLLFLYTCQYWRKWAPLHHDPYMLLNIM